MGPFAHTLLTNLQQRAQGTSPLKFAMFLGKPLAGHGPASLNANHSSFADAVTGGWCLSAQPPRPRHDAAAAAVRVGRVGRALARLRLDRDAGAVRGLVVPQRRAALLPPGILGQGAGAARVPEQYVIRRHRPCLAGRPPETLTRLPWTLLLQASARCPSSWRRPAGPARTMPAAACQGPHRRAPPTTTQGHSRSQKVGNALDTRREGPLRNLGSQYCGMRRLSVGVGIAAGAIAVVLVLAMVVGMLLGTVATIGWSRRFAASEGETTQLYVRSQLVVGTFSSFVADDMHCGVICTGVLSGASLCRTWTPRESGSAASVCFIE